MLSCSPLWTRVVRRDSGRKCLRSPLCCFFFFFFFFTLVTGRSRSLSLKLSDTKVYEPQIRALCWGESGLEEAFHVDDIDGPQEILREFPIEIQDGPGDLPRWPAPPGWRGYRRAAQLQHLVPASLGAACQGSGCSGSETVAYLRLIDSCITQIKAQGPSRTCNESKEEEEKIRVVPHAMQKRSAPPTCPRGTPRLPQPGGLACGQAGACSTWNAFL